MIHSFEMSTACISNPNIRTRRDFKSSIVFIFGFEILCKSQKGICNAHFIIIQGTNDENSGGSGSFDWRFW